MDTNLTPAPFVYRRLVTFADTDMAGIAHFAGFFRFLEEAEHALLRTLGLSVHMETSAGLIGWPRVAVQCEYQSPARFEDELAIAVTIERLGKKSITYGFHVTVGDRVTATGRVTAACCKMLPAGGIEAVEIPPEIEVKLRLVEHDSIAVKPLA